MLRAYLRGTAAARGASAAFCSSTKRPRVTIELISDTM